MIVLYGTIRIPLIQQNEALPALEAHIWATKRESGNLAFQVEPDPNDQELFHVYEEFVDEASFQEHQRLASKRVWGMVSKNFERDFNKR